MGLFDKAKDKVNFLKGQFDFSKSMEKLAVDTITPMGLLSERLDTLDLDKARLERANVIVTKQAPWMDYKNNRDMFTRSKAFQEMYSQYMRQKEARDKCIRKIYQIDPGHPILEHYDLRDEITGEKIKNEERPEPVDKKELKEKDPEALNDLIFYLTNVRKIIEGLREMGKHLEECEHHMLGFSFNEPPVDNTILVSKPFKISNSPYILANKDQAKDIEDGWDKKEETEK